MFKMDQKKVYNEFNGQTGSCNRDIPNAEESRTLCSGILSVEKEHNKDAKWLSDLKEEMVRLEQQNVVINEDEVKKQCSKMQNWKAPRNYGVQGFWIKRLDKIHERIATQLNEILEGSKEIPSSMTYRRTVLCQKDPVKGKLCGELQTNNLSSPYVEITYRYDLRGYVLFHGKRKLTSIGTKQLQEEK